MSLSYSELKAAMMADAGLAAPPQSIGPAACWPQRQASSMDLVVGFPISAIGAMCLFWGISRTLSRAGMNDGLVFLGFGILLLAIGLVMLLHKSLSSQFTITVAEGGIELSNKSTSRTLAWHEIHKLLLLEFYPHRNANLVMLATIEPKQGKPIRFDTNFEGSPEMVLGHLTQNCDYIVRNPQGYTKNPN